MIAKYRYDAWGKLISMTDGEGAALGENTIGARNPLRYRGYIYDSETGFYYLQTRYYDPVVHRFINADGYVSTGTGFNGYNMYAYCNNNPVMAYDPSGYVVTDWDRAHLNSYEIDSLKLYTKRWHSSWISDEGRAYQHQLAVELRSKYLTEGEYVSDDGHIYCDITDRLNKAMRDNAADFNSKIYLTAGVKLFAFVMSVKTGAKYDLKFTWNLDKNVTYFYSGTRLRYDDIGNIHFGYLGASIGYSLLFLKSGAGIYQIYSGTSTWEYVSSFFDDPQDSAMIEWGYNIYYAGI